MILLCLVEGYGREREDWREGARLDREEVAECMWEWGLEWAKERPPMLLEKEMGEETEERWLSMGGLLSFA